MSNKVDELVEWVADLINKVPKDGYDYGKDVAKQILSHPDLALIDREESTVIERDDLVGNGIETTRYLPVIPLKEALKEE